jgi:cell division transport system ATP-binding protein
MGRIDINREFNKIQTPVISFNNVSKKYNTGTDALSNVSFNIFKGEFVFIVGDSGSGKTTLIKLILKETLPSSGKVFVVGHETKRLRRKTVARFRRSIGVVFQDFRLLKDRDVFENVAFAQRVIEAEPHTLRHKVSKVLNLVGLSDKARALPKELSGGQQQKVAMARALVNNPIIMLADEPTGNLDPNSSREIMRLLDDINKRGTTVVVVTHNQEIVDEMQKRVIVLKDGKIVRDEAKGTYDAVRKEAKEEFE